MPCDRRIKSGQLRLNILFERRIVPQHIIQRGNEGRNAGPIRPFLVISAQALKSEGYGHADENDDNFKNEFPDSARRLENAAVNRSRIDSIACPLVCPLVINTLQSHCMHVVFRAR